MMTCCCIFCQYAVPPEQDARKRELLRRRRCEQREMPWLFGFLDHSRTQVECRGRVEFAGHPGVSMADIRILTQLHKYRTEIYKPG